MYNPALRLRELQAKDNLTDEERGELNLILQDKKDRDDHDAMFNKVWESAEGKYRPKYYDRNSNPIGSWEWGYLQEDIEYKRIFRSRLGHYLISTVWLGLDHSFFGNHGPLIFETMIFDENDQTDGDNLYMDRCGTELEAMACHAKAVEFVEDILMGKRKYTKEYVDEIIRP